MRIILSSKKFLPILGGTINYAIMMATAFKSKGSDVIIMTRTDGAPTEINGVSIVRKPSLKRRLELATWADLVLQVDASWRDVWPFLLYGKPWFPTIHNGRTNGDTDIRIWIANIGLNIAFRCGNTIPVSDQVALDWNIKNEVIKNPYNDKIFYTRPDILQKRNDILFVGRIEKSKGVFVLLEALKLIQDKLEYTLRCCFVGDGNDDLEVRKMTAKLSKHIEFSHLGRLEPDAVAATMRESKILVFPTTPLWIEASPLTPLEALACGCRIIASDSGGTRENIGPDGILISSGEVIPLAEAMLKLIRNSPSRNPDAISRFLAERTLDKAVDKYLEKFRKVMA